MSESATTGLAFLGVGVLCGAIAVFFLVRTRRFLAGAVDAQGTVISMVASSGSEGGTVYSPVVQFRAQDGQTVTFTDSVASSPPSHQAGDVITVKYSPGDPQSARIGTGFRLWFVPVLLGGLGAIFLAVGGGLYLFGPDAEAEPAASGPMVAGTPGITVPSIPVGSFLTVQEGSGAPRLAKSACEAVSGDGNTRTVELRVDGKSLTFTAKPYNGPGAYIPGSDLKVGGDMIGGELSGAAIFDQTGKSGVLNLNAAEASVSGTWDCSQT